MDYAADNNTFDNATSYGGDSLPTYAKAILVFMYTGIIILAIGGNSIVCYIVLGYKPMRTVTNYFIVNLALSDILMACLCIPFSFTANMLYNYWPFGPAMCPIVSYCQATSVFLSTFTLVSISLDRYIAIIYPLRPKMTTRQAILVICSIWIFSCTVSLPIAIVSKIDSRDMGAEGILPYCEEMWASRQHKLAYGIVIMMLQYFIPLFILIFTYFRIGFIIWVKKTPGEACSDRDQRMAASKRKMVKMMITVVLIYAVCWLPLHTLTIAQEIDTNLYAKPYMAVVWIVSQWLAMSNSMYNPLVYCWMNATYRRGFRYALRWCPCVRYTVDAKKREEMSRTNTLVTTIRGVNGPPGEGLRKHPARYMAPGEECVPLQDRNGKNGVPPKVTVTRPDLSDEDM